MINSKHVPITIAIGLVVLVAEVGILSVWPLINSVKYSRYDKSDFINPDTYQAVFLTNDQIYFGHLKNISSGYLILSDVYYVKVNEVGAGQLVRLGAIEPHKPKDKMIINQDQVLFWENLNDDSPVINTIRSMQLQKK